MSVINFYLGLIAFAIVVHYHRCLPLSLGAEKSATEAHGKESKKGRETREREGHRRGGRRFIIPLLYPPFLSVSRKNRKSAAPKKYYERDFMAAGCTLTYIHGSKDDLSRKDGYWTYITKMRILIIGLTDTHVKHLRPRNVPAEMYRPVKYLLYTTARRWNYHATNYEDWNSNKHEKLLSFFGFLIYYFIVLHSRIC